jgi:adenylate cyclase
MVHDVAYRSLLAERPARAPRRGGCGPRKSAPDPAQVGFLAYHWEEAGNLMQAASCNMKAATWHGTRDPAQALEAWKRAQPTAHRPAARRAGAPIRWPWRAARSSTSPGAQACPAAEVQPYYSRDRWRSSRDLGNMRGATLVTAAYGRSLAASGSATEYVATVTDLLEKLDETRNASLKPGAHGDPVPRVAARRRPAARAGRQ